MPFHHARMRRPHIVVTEQLSDDALARLRAVGVVTALQSCTDDAVFAAVSECAALVVRTYTRVTAELMAAAPNLRVIGRAGVGLENIDTRAAADCGVTVVYCPAAATQAVAEWVIATTTALSRRLMPARDLMMEGRFFDGRGEAGGRQLSELTFGIIGCGRIGQRVAAIAHQGFGCPILYHDIDSQARPACSATPLSLEELCARADVITLHVPLTPATRRMIDRRQLARMKPDALLVNSSRGAVVDGAAVAAALTAGTLGGCALDVFEPEPLPADHPLMSAPNCLLTPHIGARTAAAQVGMNEVVADVIAVLAGREPQFPWREPTE